uniref:Uncharacterized protein n=1 Tax=Megaviridae environmental sample TaxID=1737588 RepID=A0A5J6VLG5_9VIRU|nr:MAG: hypothetical protein [Megaviridae environmental sample]
MKSVLFVGTSDNRLLVDSEDYNDIPDLLNYDGTICNHQSQLTELEKYKKTLCNFVKNKLNDDFVYYTVDPEYSNVKKTEDSQSYKGHYSCYLSELENSLDNCFDYIVITSCYQDFFCKNNVNRLYRLLKKKKHIGIIDSVPYSSIINLTGRLTFSFIDV